ncbi:hypothetical protein NQ317_009847 [Molorchus minor]|uniref:Tyr recombinase domain-containing protein n=1 Tax=Molorchus minor TaxID=1323400 RepID=A0ABQ9K527_9CUCU|nr:hypothetical protein NQ317_009847 [Molorchus minor]
MNNCESEEIVKAANIAISNLLPTKSRSLYDIAYNRTGDGYQAKKYLSLRPPHVKHKRLFLYYKAGKCSSQPVGKNTKWKIPSVVASYLKLPDVACYTSHCLRRSSATLLADAGVDITTIKRHVGWKSTTVAEGYVKNSIENKTKIANRVLVGLEPYFAGSRAPGHTTYKGIVWFIDLTGWKNIKESRKSGRSSWLENSSKADGLILFNAYCKSLSMEKWGSHTPCRPPPIDESSWKYSAIMKRAVPSHPHLGEFSSSFIFCTSYAGTPAFLDAGTDGWLEAGLPNPTTNLVAKRCLQNLKNGEEYQGFDWDGISVLHARKEEAECKLIGPEPTGIAY